MGVRSLNTYIRNNCKTAINLIDLEQLSGKTLVIDTSIYMYKFQQCDNLLENFYLMLAIFKFYNIKPIFVFDGKPPIEKTRILDKRLSEKITAKKIYIGLQGQLHMLNREATATATATSEEKYRIERKMDVLKKQFLKIRRVDIENVKELIRAFGATYLDAENEADQLCAKLVKKKIAYACLSEDMDMFLYGCPRVLRYLSLINKNVVMYNLSNILTELDLTFNDFKDICVLCGTDYNCDNTVCEMDKAITYFAEFKKTGEADFYKWIEKSTENIDIIELYNIQNMFLLDNIKLSSCKMCVNSYDQSKIKNIMADDGFIFIR